MAHGRLAHSIYSKKRKHRFFMLHVLSKTKTLFLVEAWHLRMSSGKGTKLKTRSYETRNLEVQPTNVQENSHCIFYMISIRQIIKTTRNCFWMHRNSQWWSACWSLHPSWCCHTVDHCGRNRSSGGNPLRILSPARRSRSPGNPSVVGLLDRSGTGSWQFWASSFIKIHQVQSHSCKL